MAATPLFIVIGIYLYSDPFKVLYHYDSFYEHYDPRVNFLNQDYIATEILLNNYDKNHYDSYIFGSSRSGVYMVSDWKQYVNATACFHYNSYYEGLYGVEKKVEFLHKKHVKIKNALFIFDHELLSETGNPHKPLSRKHPLISGESNLSFQLFMFKSFLQLDFITTHIKLYFEDKKNHKKEEQLQRPAAGQVETNEEHRWQYMEQVITANPDSFYAANAGIFYKRATEQHADTPILKKEHVAMLTNIKKILDADGADYKIVISPLYDQHKLSTADLDILRSIFGQDRVADFSGINALTDSVNHYYEESHYRVPVARQIMDSIYRK